MSSPRIRIAAVAALLALPCVAAADGPRGINPAYMDTTVSPCVDFFRYANGTWLDKTTIPPSYATIGTGREMFDRNTEVLHHVLENATTGAEVANDPMIQRVGAFYGTCIDSERADREGVKPIQDELARIDAIKTRADLQREIARLHLMNVAAGFRFGDEVDPKQSTMVIGQVYQGGVGLPDKEYYTKTDSASVATRHDYEEHIGRLIALADVPAAEARSQATAVMKLETALAEGSMTRVEQRDPKAIYHKMTVAELAALAPAWNWSEYFTAIGVPALASKTAKLDVSQPEFVKAFNTRLTQTPLPEWKAYLRWQLLHAVAPLLSTPIADENFKLVSKLFGVKVQQARWKRCSAASDQALGEALGKAYVATEFPPAAKARMLELVNNLQAALRDRLATRPWMGEATKEQARKKIDLLIKKIGYPDVWRDYSALTIRAEDSYATNMMRAREFEVRRGFAKIGKPVDRNEWQMSPPTVNAYADPTRNEIVFPAGILQPPKFDLLADDASNYGSIGSVIGHELTHHFDDEGRQYDAQGNLKDWWTEDDTKQFNARADAIAKQYDGYVSVDSMHVNGRLTLGENIADLGGLTVAYYAYMKSLEGKPHPAPIDGYTAEQRFFIAFAQGWRAKLRPEVLRTITKSDPHSPAFWRVNGVVVNMPEFQAAFGCKDGAPMAPVASKRNTIW